MASIKFRGSVFSVRQEVSVLIRAGYVSHYSDYDMGWKTSELGFSCPQEHSLMCSVLCCAVQLADRLWCIRLCPSGDEGSEVPTSHLHQVQRLTLHGALFPLPLGVKICLIKFGYSFYAPFTVHRKLTIMSHFMEKIPVVFRHFAALSDVLLA